MLRFTIRDLLWLMVVVGVALGWYLDRGRLVWKTVALEYENLTEQNYSQGIVRDYTKVLRLIEESGKRVVWDTSDVPAEPTLEDLSQDATR